MTLEELNELPGDELRQQLAACCGSTRWVEKVASKCPFADGDSLHLMAERASKELSKADWLEAFSHHPRIGDIASLRGRFGERSGGWSEGEQAGLSGAAEALIEDLAAANARYEKRYGYVFIVCASGKRADEMLDLLNQRLGNDADTELEIAAVEQRKITRIRIDKLLERRRTRTMPVHTVYVGAHAFDALTPARLADDSREFFARAMVDPLRLSELFALGGSLAAEVHRRVATRLDAPGVSPVIDDLRVDFEDGYCGHDVVSDAHRTAKAAAAGHRAGDLPAGFGLRIHSMADATRNVSLRTLDAFVGDLLEAAGELPRGFVITLAKIDAADEVSRLADALDGRESAWGLLPGSLQLELMAETARSIYDAEGRLAVPALVRAGRGRCVGVHFGIYDYTASLGLSAEQQGLRHPACDAARSALQVGLAGLRQEGVEVELSDGSSRIVPSLDASSAELDGALRGVYEDVCHSLDRGIWRGWDMAPSHIVLRRLAVTAFYLRHLPAMSRRWADARGRAPAPSPPGEGAGVKGPVDEDDLEDAATLIALRTFFQRGLDSGVLTLSDLPDGFTG